MGILKLQKEEEWPRKLNSTTKDPMAWLAWWLTCRMERCLSGSVSEKAVLFFQQQSHEWSSGIQIFNILCTNLNLISPQLNLNSIQFNLNPTLFSHHFIITGSVEQFGSQALLVTCRHGVSVWFNCWFVSAGQRVSELTGYIVVYPVCVCKNSHVHQH